MPSLNDRVAAVPNMWSTDKPGGPGEWHVDHFHGCCGPTRSCVKCRRGLLCNRCNFEMGIIEKHRYHMDEIFAYLDSRLGF